jgi:hypothetical protein
VAGYLRQAVPGYVLLCSLALRSASPWILRHTVESVELFISTLELHLVFNVLMYLCPLRILIVFSPLPPDLDTIEIDETTEGMLAGMDFAELPGVTVSASYGQDTAWKGRGGFQKGDRRQRR